MTIIIELLAIIVMRFASHSAAAMRVFSVCLRRLARVPARGARCVGRQAGTF